MVVVEEQAVVVGSTLQSERREGMNPNYVEEEVFDLVKVMMVQVMLSESVRWSALFCKDY